MLTYAGGDLDDDERRRGFSAWITPEGTVHHGPGEQHDLVLSRMPYKHGWRNAIQDHHVRALSVPAHRLPKDDPDDPGKHQPHEVGVEYGAHSPIARRHAAAFVAEHHKRGGFITIDEVDENLRHVRGGTFNNKKSALNFLRGRQYTDIARARDFQFGGDESVADALIAQKLWKEES